MTPFPILETARHQLRALGSEDAPAIHAIYGDPQVTKFSEMATLASVEQANVVIGHWQKDFIHGTGIRWAIVQKSTNRVVGTCGFNWHRANFSALLSYDIVLDSWNQGIATETLRAVLDHCFTTTDTNRVSATTTLDNAPSMRVLQKLGFKDEGILHEWGFWKGRFVDLHCFALLRKLTSHKTN